MEDWEQEDFVPPKPAVNPDRWEGEDEDDVKDNWDDDEDESKEEEASVVAVQPKKKKPLAQILAEKEEKKRQELEEKRKLLEEKKVLSPEELLSEKLRQQKLQEESDLELAKETFGVSEDSVLIDGLQPKSKDDFDEFRKALVTKLNSFEGSPYYLIFLEELCRDLSLTLQPDDIKKITASLSAIAAEKIKAQKAAKGKKKSKTKASLNFGKESSITIMDFDAEYEDYI